MTEADRIVLGIFTEPSSNEKNGRAMSITHITVRGARQHNLRDVHVRIPRNALTVVTGLSG